MKTAQEPTNPAQITQRTITTRVIPADPFTSDQKPPEFWDYFEKLQPPDWNRHILYVYRVTSETGPMEHCEKFTGYMKMPDGTDLQISAQEEFLFAMQTKYGGGAYRMILKKGSERIAQTRFSISGPPKAIVYQSEPPMNGPTVSNASESSTSADVAKQAMHMVSSHESEAVNVGVRALEGAATVIQRLAGASTPQPSETDQIFRQFMVAMMQKMMNPPDPLETFARLLAMINQGSGGGGVNPVVQKIIDTGLERVLNPAMSGPPAPTAGAELVRQLPQIANAASEAVRDWRLGNEAQRDIAAFMAAGKIPPPSALPPGTPQPAAAPAPQVQPPPAPGGTMVGPPLEWIETKITEILLANDMNPDEAADETISFLARMDPRLLQQLVQHGEAGVLQLFQVRQNLRPALQNVPRLQEFIKAFFKYAAEYQAQAEAAAAADPGSVNGGAPPKPN